MKTVSQVCGIAMGPFFPSSVFPGLSPCWRGDVGVVELWGKGKRLEELFFIE